jgi:hypothetical protein
MSATRRSASLTDRGLPTGMGTRQWRWARRLLTTGAVAALAVALSAAASQGGTAAAQPGWASQTLTPPSGTLGGGLTGVSCITPTDCAAVGTAPNASTTEAMVYFWNGSTWKPQTIATPANSGGIWLNAVSCTSATSCVVVGYYYNGATGIFDTLAESWNGSTWAIQATPNPKTTGAGSFSQLNGVTCVAKNCTAVGNYVSAGGKTPGNSAPLAEGSADGKWTIQATPSPAGAVDVDLEGVSCTAAAACTAVGFSGSSNAFGTPTSALAERWNGKTWAIQTTAKRGTGLNELSSVSCVSATGCIAVGNFSASGEYTTSALAESWNGSAWAALPVPVQAGTTSSELKGVSCTSASACTAVGMLDSAKANDGLAEVWNGTAWAQQATASPAANMDLVTVSCVKPGACGAAGSDISIQDPAPQPVAETEGFGARPRPAAAAMTAPDYAGYFLNEPVPSASVVTTFTVPTVTCTSTNTFEILGDGFPSGTAILTAGVYAGCQGGTPYYSVVTDLQGFVGTLPLTVAPGDKVTVSLSTNAARTLGSVKVAPASSGKGGTAFVPLRRVRGLGAGDLVIACSGIDTPHPFPGSIPLSTKSVFSGTTVYGVAFGKISASMIRVNMVSSTGAVLIKTSKPETKTNGFTETFENGG